MSWQRCEPHVTVIRDFPYAGRWQIGDAYDTRWVRQLAAGRWAVVTRTVFRQVNDDAEALTVHSDYVVCTDPGDPGSTEIGSNDRQGDQYRTGMFSDADVQAEAQNAEVPTDDEWNAVMAEWAVS